MGDKFRDKYRINSARLPYYNYGSEGIYFITLCVGGRECWFGYVDNKTMHLSGAGKIVHNEWIKTPEIRPDMNLTLDAFCVMPNHFHAILIIGENEYNKHSKNGNNGECRDATSLLVNGRDAMPLLVNRRDAMHRVSTGGDETKNCVNNKNHPSDGNQETPNSYQNQFGPQHKNLASIMRGFKSACTKQIRQISNSEFYWQPRYYDHIIRNKKSYWKIRNYIINNPKNWDNDRFYEK